MNNSGITRNVILDLLPLYIAGEASADTISLVENYLKTDPELENLAKKMSNTDLSDIPVPASKDGALEAYIKANQRLLYRTLLLGALIVVAFMVILTLIMAIINGGFV